MVRIHKIREYTHLGGITQKCKNDRKQQFTLAHLKSVLFHSLYSIFFYRNISLYVVITTYPRAPLQQIHIIISKSQHILYIIGIEFHQKLTDVLDFKCIVVEQIQNKNNTEKVQNVQKRQVWDFFSKYIFKQVHMSQNNNKHQRIVALFKLYY